MGEFGWKKGIGRQGTDIRDSENEKPYKGNPIIFWMAGLMSI